MSKASRTVLWLTVALAALGFFVYQTVSDKHAFAAFASALRGMQLSWVIPAIALQLLAQALLAGRWLILLGAQGIDLGFFQAVKLTYLGLFYNNAMPGGVGGDLLKGWYVTRHSRPDMRTAAAVTVFVDRIIGLVGTILMAGIASLFVGSEMVYTYGRSADQPGTQIQIRWLVWGVFAAMVFAAIIFLSRHVRRALLISHLLRKLPFADLLGRIDQSIRIYRRRLGKMALCMLMTGTLQGLTIVAFWMLVRSLGLANIRLVHCLTIMPMVWLIGAAIPVPGGLGIIENCVKFLFCLVVNPDDPVAAVGQATALAGLNRVVLLYICSLPGALVPLFGGHLPKTADIKQQMTEQPDQQSPPTEPTT